MGHLFKFEDNMFCPWNPQTDNNVFKTMEPENEPLPVYGEIKDKLPKPFWDGHDDTVRCYEKTWEIAFRNLRQPIPGTKFVSNFIDTAFNGFLFMWDSSFIVMFGKYASRIFNFQKTLDNLYSHQYRDGYICREICETEYGEQWAKDDPASTGPNVLAWSEWEYFTSTNDVERLSKVFDPLCAYHKWLQDNRSWQDGTYWSCGLSCGMDNQPRLQDGFHTLLSHGFMSWIDTCAQQYLSANILVKMAKVLGREDEVDWLKKEAEMLGSVINNKMWSDADKFYYDTYRDGSLSGIKSIAAYWTLLADLVPKDRIDAFVAHLDNEEEFKRPNRIPTIAANTPGYRPDGGYWLGGVWSPTNYMVLTGLHDHGYDTLAYEIARDYLQSVTEVFNQTNTVFENYAPESAAPGNPAKPDFVGWTGLAPINILFEYVFGIHPDAMGRKIVWNVNCLEKHGIKQYPLGDATVDLVCEARKSSDEKPIVHITSDLPITVEINWNGGSEIINA